MVNFVNRYKYQLLIWLVITLLLITIVVFVDYYLRFHYDISFDPAGRGQFGDYVGGVLNPILSIFGFLAALLALIISNQTLEEARRAHRIDRTIALMEYYFSDHMLKTRRAADKWLIKAKDEDIDYFLEWMKHPDERPYWVADPDHYPVWSIIEFFQMVSIHIRVDTVDKEALKILLVRYNSWDNKGYLKKVFNKGGKLLETELSFLEDIRKLSKNFEKDNKVTDYQTENR